MALKFTIAICAVLAVAQAGYLQTAVSVPTIRYAHSVTPVEIPQPPITYAVPPKSYVAPLSPVVTTSYGYKSEHTPVPAPIIRAEHAPVLHAATPAFVHGSIVAPAIGFTAQAHLGVPLTLGHGLGFALGGYKYATPLAFGHGYATGLRLEHRAYAHY